MKRSRFIEKYKITDKLPYSPDNSVIAVKEFVDEAKSFFSDNFEGLFRIETNLSSYEYIRLPLDYIIYFFKLVVTDIHSKTLINVNFSCNNSTFSIKISAKESLPIEEYKLSDLFKAARNAGFDIEKTADGLLLTKAVLTEAALSLFTRAIVKRSVLAKRFAEIFFGK